MRKQKWYNHEWIKKSGVGSLESGVKESFNKAGIEINNPDLLIKVIELVKDRCNLLPDFVQQGSFFFQMPESFDIAAIRSKWDDKKNMFLQN